LYKKINKQYILYYNIEVEYRKECSLKVATAMFNTQNEANVAPVYTQNIVIPLFLYIFLNIILGQVMTPAVSAQSVLSQCNPILVHSVLYGPTNKEKEKYQFKMNILYIAKIVLYSDYIQGQLKYTKTIKFDLSLIFVYVLFISYFVGIRFPPYPCSELMVMC
jgi:hypothetical protein